MPALLDVQHLVKRYGDRTVVNDVSFHVASNEIVGLLGRNGAGKTTTFRMTIGMIDADQGRVVFDGRNVTDLPMYRRARRGMGYLSQEPSIFQKLSVEDNLLAILETTRMRRRARQARCEELLAQYGCSTSGATMPAPVRAGSGASSKSPGRW